MKRYCSNCEKPCGLIVDFNISDKTERDEMIEMLAIMYKEHAAPECNCCKPEGSFRDGCRGTNRCIYEDARIIIERATGKPIEEVVK